MTETLLELSPTLAAAVGTTRPPFAAVPGESARETGLACLQIGTLLDSLQEGPDGRARVHAVASEIVDASHRRARAATDLVTGLRWWYLKFFTTIHPANLAAGQRRFADAYDWIALGLDDRQNCIPPSGLTEPTLQVDRLVQFLKFEVVLPVPLYEDIANWASALLYTSRASGAFYEIIPGLVQILEPVLVGPLTAGSRIELALELAEWLLDHGGSQNHAAALARMAVQTGKHLPADSAADRTHLAVSMQGRLGILAGVDREDYAMLLRGHADPSIRLQVAAEDVRLGREGSMAGLLQSIVDLGRADEWSDTTEYQLFSAHLLRVLGPALINLGQSGRHREILQLLAAWRHRAIFPDLDEDVTFWMSLTVSGSLVVHPSETRLSPRVDHGRLAESFNSFRGSKIIVRGSLIPLDPSTGRRDEIVDGRADTAYADMVRELVGDNLHRDQTPVPAFCVVPFEPHPLQAIVAERAVAVPAWSTSLRVPRPDRVVRRVALIATDGTAEGVELPWLVSILGRNGIDMVRLNAAEASGPEIRRLYQDPSFDWVWMTGHGEFNGRSPLATNIPLESSGSLSLSEVYSWTVPDLGGRRLMVLNLCYGGMAPLLEGAGELGFGPRLAGPTQAVVSHLWNAHWMLAPLFGAVLTGALLKAPRYLEGFAQALHVLRGGQESIHRALLDLDLSDAAERCERLGVDFEALAHWGSPAFMQ